MRNSKIFESPRRVRRKFIALGGLGLVVVAIAAIALAATTVVRPSSMDGWVAQSTPPTGQVNFVNGPATPPLGVGSAQLKTGNGVVGGDDAAQLRNRLYAGTLLDDLTELGYSTWVTTNNGQQAPYLIVHSDTTGDGVADDLLFFEPPFQTPTSGNPTLPNQGDVLLNTWQTWDALNGGWYALDTVTFAPSYGTPGTGVLPLSGYIAAHPTATIVNTPSGVGGVRVLVGFASPNDVFDANVDAFNIGVNGSTDTYDFEPNLPQPTTTDQCKKGGWQGYADNTGRPFKNQGDCVSYVSTKGKNKAKG